MEGKPKEKEEKKLKKLKAENQLLIEKNNRLRQQIGELSRQNCRLSREEGKRKRIQHSMGEQHDALKLQVEALKTIIGR